MADTTQYRSQDEEMGNMLRNLISPPTDDEDKSYGMLSARQAQPQPAATAPAPAPAPPPPAAPVQTSPTGPQKSWADYVRQSNDASMASLAKSQQTADTMQAQPSVAATNAPLEAKRAALSTPIPYRDPQTGKVMTQATDPATGQTIDPATQYKPGIGTRIIRGLEAARKGGIIGALDPAGVGATPYGAPNAQYQRNTADRQGQAAVLKGQEDANIANDKADSERLGKIGTEQRAVATGYKDVASSATNEQNAENKDDVATLRQQMADQAGRPKTFEEAVILAKTDPDPERRKQYESAAEEMRQMELRKFTLAQRATAGPNEEKRQPMIDQASADVDKLNTYQWDADANDGKGGFFDPSNTNKIYSAEEFTAMKNKIATKLDADLTKAKLRPLGVRFNVKATTPGGGQQTPAQPAAKAPAQVEPTPPTLPKEQMVENRTGTDAQGNKWKVVNGQMKLVQRAGGQ
jgi:hypothetical protein